MQSAAATDMRPLLQSRLDALVLNPDLAPLLSLLKGARNGVVYGSKVRFPHALVYVKPRVLWKWNEKCGYKLNTDNCGFVQHDFSVPIWNVREVPCSFILGVSRELINFVLLDSEKRSRSEWYSRILPPQFIAGFARRRQSHRFVRLELVIELEFLGID